MILKMMIIQNNWFVIKIHIIRNVLPKIKLINFFFQCNQFFIELYEVYWLCLKNYSHFSTLNLTKLLFDRLESTKHEIGKNIVTTIYLILII